VSSVLSARDKSHRENYYGPRELALTLAWLRVCAVIGQALAVTVVVRELAFPLDQPELFAGIAVLALFAAFVLWRLSKPWPVSEAEVVLHLAVDICVLWYLLYLTGGATNPFISVYIIPVALAATALSARYLSAVVLLAGGAYAALMFRYVPLPAIHAHDAQFSLHVLGMGINFALSALLLAFFIQRLAADLRARQDLAQRVRERALRDEGILAIATQAAGAAHELNTPLSTMRTLLTELRHAYGENRELDEDLGLLAGQADRCREILRELVAVGTAHLNHVPQTVTLPTFVSGCADWFQLLRPEVELATSVAQECSTLTLNVAPGLQNALVSLLNNAADASAAQESSQVEFSVSRAAESLEFSVRDFGPGLAQDAREAAGLRFYSDKPGGLGLGLALADATAQRLDGGIRLESPEGGGTLTCLYLPLARVLDRADAG
jgi:two-component system, sensor histidine kinase RegB